MCLRPCGWLGSGPCLSLGGMSIGSRPMLTCEACPCLARLKLKSCGLWRLAECVLLTRRPGKEVNGCSAMQSAGPACVLASAATPCIAGRRAPEMLSSICSLCMHVAADVVSVGSSCGCALTTHSVMVQLGVAFVGRMNGRRVDRSSQVPAHAGSLRVRHSPTKR